MSDNSRIKIGDLVRDFDCYIGKEVLVLGRVTAVRQMRQSVFADLMQEGQKIQLRFSSTNKYNPCSGSIISASGICFYTKTNEKSIDVKEVNLISEWSSSIGYKSLSKLEKYSPLRAFATDPYRKYYIANSVRNLSRQYLSQENFTEVQTPVLCKNFNGGRSFPVQSYYLNNTLGYNRSTFEERMQALVGMGFERVFQIGSIFRSNNEYTFLEGYAAFVEMTEGKKIVRELFKFISQRLIEEGIAPVNQLQSDLATNKWEEVEFVASAIELFGRDVLQVLKHPARLSTFLRSRKVSTKNISSPEAGADLIAQLIADKYNQPVMINSFPLWDSPLYLRGEICEGISCIQRSKGFLPGQKGGIDLGVQENSYPGFIERMKQQRQLWGKSDSFEIEQSDLAVVLSGGVPPMFGFGINPDRMARIFNEGSGIDPFTLN